MAASAPRRSRVVRAVLVGSAAALLALSAGCASPGDRAAQANLRQLQASLYDKASTGFHRGSDPVVLARAAVNAAGTVQPRSDEVFAQRIEALSWSSTDGWDGTVELRLTVTTPGFQSNSIGGTSYGPGSAQRCVRFHVGADDSSTTIDCAGRIPVAVPPPPRPAAPLSEGKLRAAMKEPTLSAAERAARVSFPGLSVTSSTVDGSWVVVVVREAPNLACLGGTRSGAGKVAVSSPPRIRPGEGDCDPDRFVDGPVYGH